MNEYPIIKIRAGREWQLKRGHPWLFSGGIATAPKNLTPGALVDLHDADNNFVARGYYNPKTDIAVRVLTRNPAEKIDTAFFRRKVQQAYDLRRLSLNLATTNVFRLLHAEGDFLPGVIADYFAGVIVLQSHTAGIDRLLEPLTAALQEVLQPVAILLRNDVAVRTREGLTREEPRLLSGEIPANLAVKENGYLFAVDPWKGQKTGFFTDQRDKRVALQRYVANLPSGAKMLNCFSYTAGFSVYAAAANPTLQTVNVDQSAGALEIARQNFALNNLTAAAHSYEVADAFKWLEEKGRESERYEVVILDPPAFAKTHREKERALQGYTRLNKLGLPLVKPGGLLITCSCSGSVGLSDFEGSVREAAAALGLNIQMLELFENGLDHPVNLVAPESRYLKVLFCRISQ